MDEKPFSLRPRAWHVQDLSEGFGFAFNYSNPTGVKLLHPDLFRRVLDSGLNPIASDSPSVRAALEKLHRVPQRPITRRLSIWLHVTNQCNFRCHYCYIPNIGQVLPSFETDQLLASGNNCSILAGNLIGYCKQNGIAELKIVFAGGEPTLATPLIRRLCSELLLRAGGLNCIFGMISNGSFEIETITALVQEYGMNLSISIDGFEEGHDATRFEMVNGVRVGSWGRVSRNIEELGRRGVKPYILYTVTAKNALQILDASRVFHEMGLGIRLSLIRSKVRPAFAVSTALAEVLVSLYQGWGAGLDVGMPISRYAAFAEWDLTVKKFVPCGSCKSYFAIDEYGRAATCQMRMNRTYGSLTVDALSDVVGRMQMSSENRAFVDPLGQQGTCQSCELFHVCGGGCPQHKVLACGATGVPSPWCQVYGRVIPVYLKAVAQQLLRAARSIGFA